MPASKPPRLTPQQQRRSNRLDDRLEVLIDAQTTFLAALTDLIAKAANPVVSAPAISPQPITITRLLDGSLQPTPGALAGVHSDDPNIKAAWENYVDAINAHKASQSPRSARETNLDAASAVLEHARRLVPRGTSHEPPQDAADALYPLMTDDQIADEARWNGGPTQDDYVSPAFYDARRAVEPEPAPSALHQAMLEELAEYQAEDAFEDQDQIPEPDYNRIWQQRLDMNRIGLWQENWGPKPGQPGSQVPTHLLSGRNNR